MHPRNFGSDKIVRTKYESTSTPSCKPDSNFAFHPRVLVVNSIATRAFKEKTTTTKLIVSSDLNFHVNIDMHNRELEQEIKNKGDQFRRKNNMKIL